MQAGARVADLRAGDERRAAVEARRGEGAGSAIAEALATVGATYRYFISGRRIVFPATVVRLGLCPKASSIASESQGRLCADLRLYNCAP